MCKFTTIILLCCTFSVISTELKAQNADIDLLRTISNQTGLHTASAFVSNTTNIVAFGTPVVMAAVALIEKDDDLLKNALYVGVSIGVDGIITYGMKVGIGRPRPFVSYPDLYHYSLETTQSFPSGHTSLALPLPQH